MRHPLRRPPSDDKVLAKLHATLPGLLHKRGMLERDGHQVTGVLLPDAMRPPGWDYPAAVMGLPVTWGADQPALIVSPY